MIIHTKMMTILKKILDTYQYKLLDVRVQILNYTVKRRYSYTRWKVIVTSITIKERNNSKIHRLRVIHLYKSDHSIMMALHGRDTVYYTEENILIDD